MNKKITSLEVLDEINVGLEDGRNLKFPNSIENLKNIDDLLNVQLEEKIEETKDLLN